MEQINTKQNGDIGYIALFKTRQAEVYAKSSLAARNIAQKYFNAKNGWDVSVWPCETPDGQIIEHSITELPGA